MSYPYPQDRHRDRKEKGEQPYKDAREAMAQEHVEIETQAMEGGPEPAASREAHEAELTERLREVTHQIEEEHRLG